MTEKVEKRSEEEERPRKRRKVDEPETTEPETAPHSDNNIMQVDEDEAAVPSPQERPRSLTRVVALPSFPLPRRPDAPSKTTLALQGLDKALIDAEIVDPTQLSPFDTTPDSDSDTGLSEKMRKRLKDLGVSELFAGRLILSPNIHDVFTQTNDYLNSTDGSYTFLARFKSSQITIPAV